jgi:hypothetical protein
MLKPLSQRKRTIPPQRKYGNLKESGQLRRPQNLIDPAGYIFTTTPPGTFKPEDTRETANSGKKHCPNT